MRTSLPFAASSPFSTSLSRWLGVGDGTRSMDRVLAALEAVSGDIDLEFGPSFGLPSPGFAIRSPAAIVLTIAVICPWVPSPPSLRDSSLLLLRVLC